MNLQQVRWLLVKVLPRPHSLASQAKMPHWLPEHIVIISDLSTAKVFNVQAVSKDRSGNQVKSEGQSTIVGRASDSVLSIIFNTLQQMFGFLGEN
jgi:hypothetical protein